MQVTVHNDSFPDDQEFEIPGIGLVVNHKSKDVDASQVASYKSYGFEWPEDGNLVINQSEPKPPKEPIASTTAVGSDKNEGAAPIASTDTDDEGDN